MSYCVNCGVELDSSAKKCALCSAPVINPYKEQNKEYPLPYSDKVVLPPKVRRRYAAFIISMIIIIPNIICLLTNLIFFSGTLWALYVNSTSTVFWVIFISPFLWKKTVSWLLVIIDTTAVSLYIYFFYYINSQKGWFWTFALPAVLILAGFAGVLIEWIKRRRPDWPKVLIAVFSQICLYSIIFEAMLQTYLYGVPYISVSLIIAVSCLVIIGFFVAVQKNRRLRAWLSRKFFV
jgi:hypothetical protein